MLPRIAKTKQKTKMRKEKKTQKRKNNVDESVDSDDIVSRLSKRRTVNIAVCKMRSTLCTGNRFSYQLQWGRLIVDECIIKRLHFLLRLRFYCCHCIFYHHRHCHCRRTWSTILLLYDWTRLSQYTDNSYLNFYWNHSNLIEYVFAELRRCSQYKMKEGTKESW